MLSCSVCVLSFPLPFMMSLTILSSLRWSCAVGPACESVSHDSLFTASELSTLKTWLVRSAKEPDCKVTDRGFHVKCAVTRGRVGFHSSDIEDVRPRCVVVGFVKRGWQPGAHVLSCSVCVLSFPLPFHDVSYDPLFTALELCRWPGLRKCLSRFSLHCVGVEHIENLVGQVCERVRLQSN